MSKLNDKRNAGVMRSSASRSQRKRDAADEVIGQLQRENEELRQRVAAAEESLRKNRLDANVLQESVQENRQVLEKAEAEERAGRIAALNLMDDALADRNRAQSAASALRDSEERLRLAARATGFGTYDYNAMTERDVWSKELFDITGLPQTVQADIRLLRELIHSDDLPRFEAMLQWALDPSGPGRHELEFRIRWPNGEVRWLRDVGQSHLEGEGNARRVVRVIGTVQDITERKQIELQLQTSLRELSDAKDLAVKQERLATLGQLAGSVAHELRTPLGVIRNTAFYLKQCLPPDDEETRDSLAEMDRSIQSSDLIISEMLDFVREPARLVTSFPVLQCVHRALELVQLPESVRLTIPEGGYVFRVTANEDQVTRIFINLIQNAVHAMPKGGELEITVSETKGDKVCVRVRDTGCGIAEENLPKIFEPLFSTKTKGIGLGLAISNRYAQLNHGWIFAESKVGTGTTFRVILDRPGKSS